MNSGIGISSAMVWEKTGLLMVPASWIGIQGAGDAVRIDQAGREVARLAIPAIHHHRRRSGAKAPRRKTASISAKTRMIGPSTNSLAS